MLKTHFKLLFRVIHLSTLLLISQFLFPKIAFSATQMIESSADCIQGTISESDDIGFQIHGDDSTWGWENSSGLLGAWFWGTHSYFSQGSGWLSNTNCTTTANDILKLKYEDGMLYAYVNDQLCHSHSVSANLTGSYIGYNTTSATISNFGECTSPTPTPEITPTPTDTPTPTPTVTPTPNPNQTYVHQICMSASSYNTSYPTNLTLPYELVNSGGVIVRPRGYDISALDLESLKTKDFIGYRIYQNYDVSGSVCSISNFTISTQFYGETTYFIRDYDDKESESGTEYSSCNGYSSYHSKEWVYSDIFNEDGSGKSTLYYDLTFGQNCGTDDLNGDINNTYLCILYEDTISTGAITDYEEDSCTLEPEIETTSCPTFLSDAGGFFECHIQRLKNWFINLFIIDSDLLSETISLLFLNFEESIDSNVASIISAPLSVIGDLTTATCTPLDLPLPFVDENLQLPCFRPLLSSQFPTFFVLWDLVTTGVISYYVVLGIFKILKNTKDPDNDKIEVMDI